MTRACVDVMDHPVVEWLKADHPFALCTDDISLFNKEIFEEWHLLKNKLDLSNDTVEKLITKASTLSF